MADLTEPEIPESDDVPDEDEDTQTEPVADDEPHDHVHTPGYPDHRHTGDGIEYDAGQVNVAGGLDLHPEERHDSDSAQAQALNAERAALADLGPLGSKLAAAIEEAGGTVRSHDQEGDDGRVTILLDTPDNRGAVVTLAYN